MPTTRTGGRVLGVGCGQPHGSAEILLKAALRAADEPLPLEEVEPATSIVKRFTTGAMSLGALGREALAATESGDAGMATLQRTITATR